MLPNSMLNGCRLVASPLLTETKESHRRERKWARRVMYQRERRFDITMVTVPSSQIIRAGDVIYAHPETIKRIERAIEKAGR